MNRRRFSATVLAGTTGTFAAMLGSKTTGAHTSQNAVLETWTRPQRGRPLLAANTSVAKLARAIWDSYALVRPNHYDTVDVFCEAIVADWARQRSAYVWRYASSLGPQVYVLPARFVLAHPPFLPDFPEGYYRLDPAFEAEDAKSCIHPSAFFRILTHESVDKFAPAEIVPMRG